MTMNRSLLRLMSFVSLAGRTFFYIPTITFMWNGTWSMSPSYAVFKVIVSFGLMGIITSMFYHPELAYDKQDNPFNWFMKHLWGFSPVIFFYLLKWSDWFQETNPDGWYSIQQVVGTLMAIFFFSLPIFGASVFIYALWSSNKKKKRLT